MNLLFLFVLAILAKCGESIMCHRCFSSMGGCGNDGVVWRMFPWRDCGESKFCVKVITHEDGEEAIIRECEDVLMKSTYHRLRMPVLRRHGYCINARKNDFWNPEQTTNPKMEYCFCNDLNGCNSAPAIYSRIAPVLSLCSVLLYLVRSLVL